VIIEAEKKEGGVVFRVANDGSQVAQSDVAVLMDRFSRADRSRAETGVHCGLGLAIVKRIVSVLRGSIVLRSSVGGEFEATLSLATREVRIEGQES
jgi:signal transduction histidine kinase